MRPFSRSLFICTLAGTCLTLTACSLSVSVENSTLDVASTAPEPYSVIDNEQVPVPDISMGDRQTVDAIIDEGKNHSQVMDHLYELTVVHGPRLTGSSNLQNAQRWAKTEFESWGLDESFMHQWGVIETRFDRGTSTGKVLLDNHDEEKDNKVLREMEFSTLSWSSGTDGPQAGSVIQMPATAEEFNANRGSYSDSWVMLSPDYTGNGGIRSVGYQMRQRMDDRENARNQLSQAAEQSVQANSDANEHAWSGHFDYHGSPVPATLTFDESANPVTGMMIISGFSEGPIADFDRDGDTITFLWEHAMGKSNIELNFDGDQATGVSKSSSGNQFDLTFAKGAAPKPEESKSSSSEDVLAMVLNENPLGFISSSMDERVWTTSSNNWRSRAAKDYPQDIEINVRQSDFDFLSTRSQEGVDLIVEFNLEHTLTAGPIPVYNVIAEIKGSEFPDEVVIISGHVDSWDGPGSMGTCDNATGSAVTMEAARILMAAGANPKRTIRFALWGGEEQGLLGSKSYLDSLSENERDGISATFVDDGGTNYQGGIPAADYMVGYLAAATAPTNGKFYSEIDDKYLDVNIRPTGMKIKTHSGSDHAPFNKVGIPGFFWDESGRADYRHTWHTQNDTFDYAIEEYLIQSATNAAIVAYNLANAPELLPRSGEVFSEQRSHSIIPGHTHEH